MAVTRYPGTGPLSQNIINGMHQVAYLYGPLTSGAPLPLGDGTSRLLSAHYADLAAVEAAYPNLAAALPASPDATTGLQPIAMGDELAWAVVQEAIYSISAHGGGTLRVGGGTWRMNRQLIVANDVQLDLAGATIHFRCVDGQEGIAPRNRSSVRNGAIEMEEIGRTPENEAFGSGQNIGAAVVVGKYVTPDHTGFTGVVVENLTLSTNRDDPDFGATHMLIVSDSNAVTVRNVRFADSAGSLACILMHWSAFSTTGINGEFDGYTKHPHDVLVENCDFGSQTWAGASGVEPSCVFLSGVRNVTVRNCIATECQGLAFATVGDWGFYLADPAVLAAGMTGVNFEACTSLLTNGTGVNVSLFADNYMDREEIDGVYEKGEVTFSKCSTRGKAGSTAAGFRVRKSRGVNFVDCRASGHLNGYLLDDGAQETMIVGGAAVDNILEGVYVGLNGTGGVVKDNTIAGLEASGNGRSITEGVTDTQRSGIRVENAQRTVVRGCILGGEFAENYQVFGVRVGDGIQHTITDNVARRTKTAGFGFSIMSSETGFDGIHEFRGNRALSGCTNYFGGLNPVPVKRFLRPDGTVINTELWGQTTPAAGQWQIGDLCWNTVTAFGKPVGWKCINTALAPLNVTAATNAEPIIITTASGHGRQTGDRIVLAGAEGNTAASGVWAVVQVNTTQLELVGSVGNGAYTNDGGAIPWATIQADSGTWVPASVGDQLMIGTGFQIDVTKTAGADMWNAHIIQVSLPSPMRTPGHVSIGDDFAPNIGAHADPARVLTVAANSLAVIELKRNTGSVGAALTYIDSYSADGILTRVMSRCSEAAAGKGVLAIQTHDGTTLADRVVIDEDGHVGLGTAVASTLYTSGRILAIQAPGDKVAAFVGARNVGSGDAALTTFAGRNNSGQCAEVLIMDGVAPDAVNKGRIKLRVSQASNTMSDAVTIESDRSVTLAVPLAAPQGGSGHASFTKGDVLVATSSSALTKLAVGTNAHVLTADSAEASGVKWAAPASGGVVSLNALTGALTIASATTGVLTVGAAGSTVTLTIVGQTKGHLLAGTGSGVDWLPVGSNGQLLSANSAQSTGLEWIAAPSAGVTAMNSLTGSLTLAGTGLTVTPSGGTITLALPALITAATYCVGDRITPVTGSLGYITLDVYGRVTAVTQAT